MKYRDMCGEKVSVLGLGCMRLPTVKKDGENIIDEQAFLEMADYSVKNGINYFDTAFGYHNGTSEIELGKVIKELGIRERIFIADKLPPWNINADGDVEKVFQTQLNKVQTDYFDFFLLHNMTKEFWDGKIADLDVLNHVKEFKKQGRIRHLGFSFHDDLETFKRIIDSSDGAFEFCQIQLNYADAASNFQAGLEGLKYASDNGLSVVIMEPLKGGKLVVLPEHVSKILPEGRTIVENALDFLWDMKEISILLSGMGSMEQLKENIKYASRSDVGMLSEDEKKRIMEAGDIFNKGARVQCTGCRYCMPCPANIDIPEIFKLYNEQALTYTWEDEPSKKYLDMEYKADACVKCRNCVSHCPQNFDIPKLLEEAGESLSK